MTQKTGSLTFKKALSGLLFFAILMCPGCKESRQTLPVSVTEPKKDLLHFRLPERTKEAAPQMQDHLLALLKYNTTRFEIKPDFVFLENDNTTEGRLNPAVTRMNLLHLAYYEGERLIWSGSLLSGLGRGVIITTEEKCMVTLAVDKDRYRFEFKDEERVFSIGFHNDRDFETWLENGSSKLYLNYYVFPESLVLPEINQRELQEK